MSTTKTDTSGRSGIEELFHRFAGAAARATGTAWAFMAALGIIVVWAMLGPAFGYSDTWQLVINTSTTIITFLMVFLIQNTQNRDAAGIHLKLDELIKATGGARNTMIDLEKLSDAQLRDLEQHYKRIACGEDAAEDT